MTLSVTLEFSDQELDYFRSLMHRIRGRNGHRSPEQVAAAAAAEVQRLQAAARSPFVARRIERVGRLIAMVQDPEWQLPEPERTRVLDGLAYVADAQDLVPDNTPVLGLVDDAIMLELVLRELQHEIEGYEEFDAYRREEAPHRDKPGVHRPVSRADWLESKRVALLDRIRERRERDLARDGEAFRLITRF
jgi:uncharacterized membrane protein YkvA (DUF1232 family)